MGWGLVLLQVGIIGGNYVYQRWLKDKDQDDPKRDGFRIPRSRENGPIPLVYGTVRVDEPYLMGVFAYGSNPILEGVVTVGHRYTAAMDFGIGVPMGATGAASVPYSEMRSIWVGGRRSILTLPLGSGAGGTGTGHFIDDEHGGLSLHYAYWPGTFDQPRDPGLLQNFINDPNLDETLLPTYPGLAHLVFRNNGGGSQPLQSHWGPSGSMPAIAAEIYAVTAPLGYGAIVDPKAPTVHPVTGNLLIYAPGHDASIPEVVFDLMCNTFGRAGMAESKIDTTSFEDAAETLETEGMGMSAVFGDARELVDILGEIMAQAGGIMHEDFEAGLVKMKLLRDDYVASSLPVYGLDQLELVEWEDASDAATFNALHLTYTSRAHDYREVTISAVDRAHATRFGLRPQSVRYPYCCTELQARRLLARDLAMFTTATASGTLRGRVRVAPGDVFKLDCPARGIDRLIVRVLRRRRLPGGLLEFDVVDDAVFRAGQRAAEAAAPAPRWRLAA